MNVLPIIQNQIRKTRFILFYFAGFNASMLRWVPCQSYGLPSSTIMQKKPSPK